MALPTMQATVQEDPPIPEDDRIDRDPREPIQPPAEDDPEDPARERPIEEPEDSPTRGEPERRDPGVNPPIQLGNPGEEEEW